MTKNILVVFLLLVSTAEARRSKKPVHIHSFGKVVAAVSRVASFKVSLTNGDEAATYLISCPDKMARTTFNDVSQRSAFVSLGTETWESLSGISGPWVKRTIQPLLNLCGDAGLVFPANLDLRIAVRGEPILNERENCEQWTVRTKQKDSPKTYTYCVGSDKLPLWRTVENRDSDSFDLYTLLIFFDWNKPIRIESPKDGEPPCCPPMR